MAREKLIGYHFRGSRRTAEQLEYLQKRWGFNTLTDTIIAAIAQAYILDRADTLKKRAAQSEDDWLQKQK